jgi:hypothetical protein
LRFEISDCGSCVASNRGCSRSKPCLCGLYARCGNGKTILGFAAIILAATAHTFAGSASDPLWQKALAVAQSNGDWVAGLTITRSEVVYKGETNGVHEIWQRSELGKDGEVTTRLAKVFEDGKDVTEQEKKKENGKKASTQPTGSPFSVESQARLFLTVTNRSRMIAGKDCVGYLFEVRNTNAPKTRGVAWLERATGIPVELENVTLDPLPDKRMKEITITTRYESTTDGTWRVKEMWMLGKVSVFFIKADVRSTTSFRDYWKLPMRPSDEAKDKK